MRNFFKVFVGVVAIATVLSANTVLAKVGSKQITDSDIEKRIANLPAQYANYYSSKEGKVQLLDQMIEEELLYLEASANGYDSDSEVKEILTQLKQEVATKVFVRKELEKVTISEAQIRAYYEANKAKFSEPEQVRASHILVADEALAKGLTEKIKGGADFAELAKEHSTCPSGKSGGDLNFFSKGRMVPEFEDAAFKLKNGEVTAAPVKTQFGWHVVKVTERKAAQGRSLAEVSPEIRSELLNQKQQERLNELIAAAQKKHSVTKL